jgi:signal transduction histidine kinase
MTLRRRLVIMSLLVAVPAALLLVTAVERLRARDMRLALQRIVRAHATDLIRDACQADPRWFLAGPRTGRPSMAARQQEDADIRLPRPSTEELPLEVFAYDDQFLPTSTEGPRFPNDFRDAMRSSPPTETMYGAYESTIGTGIQIAQLTGWSPGPCAVLLFRMQPNPNQRRQRVTMFFGFTALIATACFLAFLPTVARMRRLALAAGASSRANFETIAPDASKDEIGAMVYVFNDAGTQIHRRRTEIADRIEALRRFTTAIDNDIAAPLDDVEAGIASLAAAPGSSGPVRDLLWKAHDVRTRLRNLAAANHLRQQNDSLPVERVDLAQLVRGVVDRHLPLARAADVDVSVALTEGPLPAAVHAAYTAQAIGNVLDNAIRYTEPPGAVRVTLEPRASEVFALTIANVNPPRPISDELLSGLTAQRRFRGDEGWNRRPNAPGLGLAVAREIADRSGLGLELHRRPDGGVEAVFIGGQTPTRG